MSFVTIAAATLTSVPLNFKGNLKAILESAMHQVIVISTLTVTDLFA